MKLRPYQADAIAAVNDGLRSRVGNPCLVLPTGAGKTVVFAELLRQWWDTKMYFRAAVLAHRTELLTQSAKKILAAWPDAPLGIWSAGLKSANVHADLLVAGIQTLAKNPGAIGHRDCIIVDEAHRIPFSGDGQYRSVLAAAKKINPKLVVLGVTATPFRMDGGRVCNDSGFLNYIAYSCPPALLVGAGYLAEVRYEADPSAQLDLDGVHVRSGEFVAAELEARELPRTATVVAHAMPRLAGRSSVLWFCASVAHAEAVAASLPGSLCVTGETPQAEREAAIEAFKSGEVRHLVNVDVFTEGFDAPSADAAVLMRATNSPGRYVQMAGRVMRPHPGKADALLLDYAGNVYRHGFVDHVYYEDLRPRDPKEPDLLKSCPLCFACISTDEPACECGFVWPVIPVERKGPDENLTEESFTSRVDRVEFAIHSPRDGRPPSVLVEYWCGMRCYPEWLAVESTSDFARRKGWKRLAEFGVGVPYPITAKDAANALHYTARRPTEIRAKRDGKFWRVERLIWA